MQLSGTPLITVTELANFIINTFLVTQQAIKIPHTWYTLIIGRRPSLIALTLLLLLNYHILCIPSMAQTGLSCADVSLRNYSLKPCTHWWQNRLHVVDFVEVDRNNCAVDKIDQSWTCSTWSTWSTMRSILTTSTKSIVWSTKSTARSILSTWLATKSPSRFCHHVCTRPHSLTHSLTHSLKPSVYSHNSC